MRSPTFKDLLDNGEGKSLKTWSKIFRPLCNKAKEANAHTPIRGGWVRDKEDQGLINFAMAMKTSGGVAFDSLNSPKCFKYRFKEVEDKMEDESIGLRSAKRDSRFMHLRTSLALVKGELVTQAFNAPYAMVHGGLHGTYVVLAAFKEKLASKASTTQADELITDTNTCYDKNAEAYRAVVQLGTLGSIWKVVNLEHELQEITFCTNVLENTLEKASKFVMELNEYVSKLAELGAFTPAGQIQMEE